VLCRGTKRTRSSRASRSASARQRSARSCCLASRKSGSGLGVRVYSFVSLSRESGKSTLLKQFQLLHSTGDVFDSERASWRLIIFHNLVRSVLDVLNEINQPITSNKEHPDNDEFYRTHSTTFKTMQVWLSPLSQYVCSLSLHPFKGTDLHSGSQILLPIN
jgi:hypothetical protein